MSGKNTCEIALSAGWLPLRLDVLSVLIIKIMKINVIKRKEKQYTCKTPRNFCFMKINFKNFTVS